MWPALAVRIENAVTVYNLVVSILQQRKVKISRESSFQLLDEFLRILVAVDADGKNLDPVFFFFGQETFQLSELTRTIGSPKAAVKDQNDVFLLPEFGKGNSFAVHVL